MPSVIPGFEYDIFISYRHNDNRSGWVTEFVNALQEELAATIKEPISIYFDKNPHDGLLETHNVDKSLEGKLKCLIFIPIISQTYCDPKSFAWQHEFCAFNRIATRETDSLSQEKSDAKSIGRDIKLLNGNVASRILPIKIHDLDEEDVSSLEDEIGSVLRAVEFIYKEPGVNRSLKISDDRSTNQNKTDYGNQLNKVANAVKEIISGIKNVPITNSKAFLPIKTDKAERSIVVLPFVNISNDPEQEYFSDGLTEELIMELSRLKELLVISRSSAMTFKDSNKTIREIAREVNVRYVLEGSVRKAGNNLRITAQLIDAVSDAHVWAEKYDGVIEDVFGIQEKVSLSIVDALKLKLTPEERNTIVSRPIANVHAYEYYLKARQEMYRGTKERMELTFKLLDAALELAGPNELLYATLGYANYFYFRFVDKLDQSYLARAEEYGRKVLALNPDSAHGHVIDGWIHTSRGDLQESVRSMKKALAIDPQNQEALSGIAASYIWAGRCAETSYIPIKLLSIDPLTSFSYIVRGGYLVLNGQILEGLEYFEKAYTMDPQGPVNLWQLASAYFWCGKNEDAYPLVDRLAVSSPEWPVTKQMLFLKHGLMGQREEALKYATDELIVESKNDPHFAFHIAECYAVINEKEKALNLLEMAIMGFYPYKFLTVDPLLANLRSEKRFSALIAKAKEQSDSIEI